MKRAAPSLKKMNRRHFREVVVVELHEELLEAMWAELGQAIDPKGSRAKLRYCGSPAGGVWVSTETGARGGGVNVSLGLELELARYVGLQ
jgi:hypothetical protein